MLRELREILNKTLVKSEEGTEDRNHALQLATATLLVEVVRADHEEDFSEGEAVFSLLKDFFALDLAEPLLW